MKRALTAAVVSGFLVLAVPQAAFADHAPDRRGDGRSEQAAGPQPDGQPDGTSRAEGAPPPDQPYADRENQGDDEEEFLLF